MKRKSNPQKSLQAQVETRWKKKFSDIRLTILREKYGLNDQSDINECIDIFIIYPANKWSIHRVMIRTKGSYGHNTKIWWVYVNDTHLVISGSKPSQPSIPAASMPRLEKGRYHR